VYIDANLVEENILFDCSFWCLSTVPKNGKSDRNVRRRFFKAYCFNELFLLIDLELVKSECVTELPKLRNDVDGLETNLSKLAKDFSTLNKTAITDIKFGSKQQNAIWRGEGYFDTVPYVITEVSNFNRDEYADNVARRKVLRKVDGTWKELASD
ncbi:Tail fiber protein S', partial [Orchesella cincta]